MWPYWTRRGRPEEASGERPESAKISSVERESVRRRRHRSHKRSLARQLFLMQAAVIVVTAAVGAAVAVPVLDWAIGADLVHELPRLLGVAAVALAVGAVLSLLVAAHLARKTHGLEAREITKLYEHNEAVLHAIREGVLVTDRDGRLLLANDEARRLLELPEDAEGRLLGHSLPNGSLRVLLASQRSTRDETHLVGGRVLIVNQSQAFVDGLAALDEGRDAPRRGPRSDRQPESGLRRRPLGRRRDHVPRPDRARVAAPRARHHARPR